MAKTLGYVVVLVLVMLVHEAGAAAATGKCLKLSQDPCLSTNHIKIDNEKRSTGFKWNATSGAAAIDDASLSQFWYRFVSGAGGYIPTTCPTRGQCGTMNTIWMQGTLPTSDGSTHLRKMCVNDGSSCTSSCFDTCVKSCGDFTVYELQGAPSSKTAYCAGDKVRCPAGTVSTTGFSPCEDPSKIPADPQPPKVVLEPTANSFNFKCVLQNPGARLKHHIRWFAGGNLLLAAELNSGATEHSITEYQINYKGTSVLGTHLWCEVYAIKDITPKPKSGTPWISSSKPGYFLGVEVVDRNGNKLPEVTLKEGDTSGKDLVLVYFRSTIPIRCNTQDYLRNQRDFNEPCNVFLYQKVRDLDKYKKELTGLKCGSKAKEAVEAFAQQVKFGTCDISLQDNLSKRFQDNSLKIQAFRDNLIELNPETRFIEFTIRHEYQAIWKGYQPAALKVTATEISKGGAARPDCKSYTDPNLKTFDSASYQVQDAGEFVLYENVRYNYRVHVFTKKCGRGSCNCGVAAQAGNDVIVVDKCKTFATGGAINRVPTYVGSRSIFRLRAFIRNRQTDGFDFERHGNEHYVIRFPHGAVVNIKIRRTYVDVLITPSELDKSKLGNPAEVRGLCGVYNGRHVDDLQLKDGTSVKLERYPTKFSNDWKVDPKNSLYNGNAWAASGTGSPEKRLCICYQNKGKKSGELTICDFRTSCPNIKELKELVASRTIKRRKRSEDAKHDYIPIVDDSQWVFEYDDTPFDPTKVTWSKGWNETKARSYCSTFLNASATVKACRGVTGVNENEDFEMCVNDIKLTGGTDFAKSAVDSVKSKCEEIVSTDMRLWKPDPTANATASNFSFVMPPLEVVNEVCPGDCSNNGKCVGGGCVCDTGYMDDDCSIKTDTPPEVFLVPQEGLCDTTVRPCRSTPVIGDGFIDNSNLTCHFQTVEVTDQGFRSTAEEHETTPEFESYMELHCPLPTKHVRARRQAPVGTPVVGYNLTVSNNGKLRSVTSVTLLVYDSRCQACNGTTGLCHLKPNTCLIRGYCQLPGDRSGTDACLTCDPTTSTSGWTKINYCPITTTESTTLGAEAVTEDGLGLPVWAIAVICVAAGAGIAVVVLVAVRLLKKTSVAPPPYQEEMKPAERANTLFKVSERPSVGE